MDNNVYLLRCRQHRRAGARRRGRRARPGSSRWSAPTGCAGWSPPTGTGTTTARCPRWSRPPAPRRSPGAADADELPVPVDARVADGDTVQVGDCRLEVIHLVGHTPGSIALLYDDPDGTPHLFTGDSLFPGGVGKTWSPEDFTSLIDDVSTQAVRPAARRDLVLPRPRRRLDAGRRASAPRGVASQRLVSGPHPENRARRTPRGGGGRPIAHGFRSGVVSRCSRCPRSSGCTARRPPGPRSAAPSRRA